MILLGAFLVPCMFREPWQTAAGSGRRRPAALTSLAASEQVNQRSRPSRRNSGTALRGRGQPRSSIVRRLERR